MCCLTAAMRVGSDLRRSSIPSSNGLGPPSRPSPPTVHRPSERSMRTDNGLAASFIMKRVSTVRNVPEFRVTTTPSVCSATFGLLSVEELSGKAAFTSAAAAPFVGFASTASSAIASLAAAGASSTSGAGLSLASTSSLLTSVVAGTAPSSPSAAMLLLSGAADLPSPLSSDGLLSAFAAVTSCVCIGAPPSGGLLSSIVAFSSTAGVTCDVSVATVVSATSSTMGFFLAMKTSVS
mmetsp:Transcript_104411/g.290904  ORF Transcript_104411/g.290904 Transcript_104411/m.290904 type:complete len:236 (-) Transcript_104411:322-1029(-)